MAASRDATFRLKTESNPSGIDDVSEAFDRAEKTAKKLADPNLSPRELQRTVIQLAVQTDTLKDAMASAAKNGETFGKTSTESVQRFEKAMAAANVQAAKMRDTAADLRVKGDQAAQGFEKMTQYGGSATSMMQGLADTSNGLVGGFGKAALAVVGFTEAAKLGWDAGNKARLLFQELTGKELPSLTNQLVELGTGIKNASGEFDRSGASITAYRERIDRVKLSIDLAKQALDQHSERLSKMTPEVARAALVALGHAEAIEKTTRAYGSYIMTSVGVGQVTQDMTKSMIGAKDAANAVSEADVELARATKAFELAQINARAAQREYDESLKKNSSNTNSLGEYTKETKDEIDRLEGRLRMANVQLAGTSKAMAEAAAAAKAAVPAFDPLAGAFYTAEEAAGKADSTIGTMEFTMGKTGKEAVTLGGGFKGAATAMDTAKQAGVELSNASGTLTASMAGMADEQGPVKKLGGGFKGLHEAATPTAGAIGEISNKTGELTTKITPLSDDAGPVVKLAGGFGQVKDAGGKLIERNSELITSIGSLNTAMETGISTAERYRAAMAAAAGAGGNK